MKPKSNVACFECGEEQENDQLLETHIAVQHLSWFPFKCTRCSFAYLPTEYSAHVHFSEQHPGCKPTVLYEMDAAKRDQLFQLLSKSISCSSGTEAKGRESATFNSSLVQSLQARAADRIDGLVSEDDTDGQTAYTEERRSLTALQMIYSTSKIPKTEEHMMLINSSHQTELIGEEVSDKVNHEPLNDQISQEDRVVNRRKRNCKKASTTPKVRKSSTPKNRKYNLYRCFLCASTITETSISRARRHAWTHLPMSRFNCPVCPAISFARPSVAKEHIARKHTDDPQLNLLMPLDNLENNSVREQYDEMAMKCFDETSIVTTQQFNDFEDANDGENTISETEYFNEPL